MSDTHPPPPPSRTLSSLDDWPDLWDGAQVIATERGRAIPGWAWEAVAATAVATQHPTVALVYELARVFADHGVGKP